LSLYLATVQQYAGNLIYLAFRQQTSQPLQPDLEVPRYAFKNSLPSYNEAENVWSTVQTIDRLDKRRWRVSEPTESVNLKGVQSTTGILAAEPAPVLLLILPVNRRFYEYHELDMASFDSRYRDIRAALHEMAKGQNIYLIDLFDEPRLHFGFRDRMHMDAYGFAQLAKHIYDSGIYKRYLDAVRQYYRDYADANAAASEKTARR
jgi:poly-D-alanine transfer protein DltD